jgi:hypothetical protein
VSHTLRPLPEPPEYASMCVLLHSHYFIISYLRSLGGLISRINLLNIEPANKRAVPLHAFDVLGVRGVAPAHS